MSQLPSAEELYEKISSIPTPREIVGRARIVRLLVYLAAGIFGVVALSFGTAKAYQHFRVKWYGKDFKAIIQEVGDVHGRRVKSRTITLSVSIGDQNLRIKSSASAYASGTPEFGQEVTVRCLPEFPDYHPIILSLGGGGWMDSVEIALILLVGFAFVGLSCSQFMQSKRNRYLVQFGDVAIGRLLRVGVDEKGKLSSCEYEFVPSGGGNLPVQGMCHIPSWAPQEGIAEGAEVVILHDAQQPERNVPYLMSEWMILGKNGDRSTSVENTIAEIEGDTLKSWIVASIIVPILLIPFWIAFLYFLLPEGAQLKDKYHVGILGGIFAGLFEGGAILLIGLLVQPQAVIDSGKYPFRPRGANRKARILNGIVLLVPLVTVGLLFASWMMYGISRFNPN